jgi:hypothetical protein
MIDAKQIGIVRREQVDDGKERGLVTVVGWWIAAIDAEHHHQGATARRLRLGTCGCRKPAVRQDCDEGDKAPSG